MLGATPDTMVSGRDRTNEQKPGVGARLEQERSMTTRPRTAARVDQGKSQLIALRDNLNAVDAHLRSIQRPVHSVKDLIGRIKGPLAFPGALHKDLSELYRLLSSLRTIMTPLSILPAPIGPAARAFKQTLETLTGPPKSGSIGRARDLAGQIDKSLKPLRDLVAKIEKPVDDIAATIDEMEGRIAYLQQMVARVVARYGERPPADVEACAAKLNEPIAELRAGLDKAAAKMAKFFSSIENALRSALAVLKPVGDALKAVRKVLGTLRGRAMQSVIKVLSRFSNAIKPFVNKVEFIVNKVINGVLKKLGINMGAFTRYIRNLMNVLNPLKPIEKALARTLASIKRFVAKLVDVHMITDLLAQLTELKRRLAQIVEAFLRGPCKAVLDADSGRARARLGR